MKVLFAIGSAVTSEKLANLYYQTYGEKIEYKDVFYFKAILEEVKRDKTYDRIVIAEELEPMQTNVVDAINQMLLSNLDSITDEVEDSPIIFICSQNRNKSDSFIGRLFNMGIYNFLIGDDRQEAPLCKLIKEPRNKKEAKIYLNANPAEMDLKNEQDDGVDERELISICNYFERLKTSEEYVRAFSNVAEQYSDDDLSTIVASLTTSLKRGQDIFNALNADPRYSKYCAWQSKMQANHPSATQSKKAALLGLFSKKKVKASDNENLKNAIENKRKQENVMSHVVSPDDQLLDQQAQIRAKAEENERLIQEELKRREQEEQLKKQKQEELIKQQEELLRKQQEELLRKQQEELMRKQQEELMKKQQEELMKKQQEELLKKQQEELLKKQQEQMDVNPIGDYQKGSLNGVGAVAAGIATALGGNASNQEDLIKKQQEELMKQQQEELMRKQQEELMKQQQEELMRKQQEELMKKQQEELMKKQQEELMKQQQEELMRKQQEELMKQQQEELMKQQQEELLRKQQEEKLKAEQEERLRLQQEAMLKAQREAQEKAAAEEERRRLEAENLRIQQQENEEALRREALIREQEEALLRQQEEIRKQREEAQAQINSYANNSSGVIPMGTVLSSDTSAPIAPTAENVESYLSTISPQVVPADYKKVVAFVGPNKAGTSFMANCVGTLLALKGVKTSILDMTRSRGLYWYYSDAMDKKFDLVSTCMSCLSAGQANNIPIGKYKDLNLYTTVPKGKEDNRKGYRHKTVIETAKRNCNLLIIDCDFTTPAEYFEQAQEIYVIQDLDLIKVAETREFFRELKSRRTDWSKLRLVINNNVKCNITSKKIRKSALTFYQDPSYTYTEDFDEIKTFVEIPLQEQNYATYYDGMEKGKLAFEKFAPEFKKAIDDLSTIVYGIPTKKKGMFGG